MCIAVPENLPLASSVSCISTSAWGKTIHIYAYRAQENMAWVTQDTQFIGKPLHKGMEGDRAINYVLVERSELRLRF